MDFGPVFILVRDAKPIKCWPGLTDSFGERQTVLLREDVGRTYATRRALPSRAAAQQNYDQMGHSRKVQFAIG